MKYMKIVLLIALASLIAGQFTDISTSPSAVLKDNDPYYTSVVFIETGIELNIKDGIKDLLQSSQEHEKNQSEDIFDKFREAYCGEDGNPNHCVIPYTEKGAEIPTSVSFSHTKAAGYKIVLNYYPKYLGGSWSVLPVFLRDPDEAAIKDYLSNIMSVEEYLKGKVKVEHKIPIILTAKHEDKNIELLIDGGLIRLNMPSRALGGSNFAMSRLHYFKIDKDLKGYIDLKGETTDSGKFENFAGDFSLVRRLFKLIGLDLKLDIASRKLKMKKK
jgi:hypothetical protein